MRTNIRLNHCSIRIGIMSCCLMFAAGMLSLSGCQNIINRGQSPDAKALKLPPEATDGTEYISEVCGIWGLNYDKVEGIGLAGSLRETGSNPRKSGQRDYLIRELDMKLKDRNVEKLLAADSTEMVLLQGLIPPGARKGERFDIEVRTMPRSDASSLNNGMVLQTRLRPMEVLGNSVKKGHVKATGKGRILVDALFISRIDQSNQVHGYILGGGVTLEDRKLGLTVRSEDFHPKTTTLISRAINARFTTTAESERRGVAEPKTDRIVELEIPAAYRHNVGRYLQVISNMAFGETVNHRLARLEDLEKQLLDPQQAGVVSLRLEAIGKDAIPALKRALLQDNLEVKFYAAQSLAYQNEVDGVQHLKQVAISEPAFRWHALTALASLDKSESRQVLEDLMHVKSAETRYGAFRAYRQHSPNSVLATGQWMSDCYVHQMPSTADSLLHFSRSQRPEIVVFGDQQTVSGSFLYIQSGLTIKATGNGNVSITDYAAPEGEQRQTCSTRVTDLIQVLTNKGLGYGDILTVFREAADSGCLNSRLVINSVPKLGRTYIPGQVSEPQLDPATDKVATEIPTM